MFPDPGAFAHDLTGISEADALFAALDQTAIDDGIDRWTASVLSIHGDERHWWVDVAIASNNSVNVILQLSRHAKASHAVAALRTWQPNSSARPVVLKTMCRS